jgi:ABC-type antimicrobial peptide transport system permease subunit
MIPVAIGGGLVATTIGGVVAAGQAARVEPIEALRR